MELALVISSRCNAACRHCATSCGPTRTESLPFDRIAQAIDDAAAIDDGEALVVHITGGEPFLDFELLVSVVERARGRGGKVTCATNAYWATSEENARAKLQRLREAGLSLLGVSVSSFHQEFVPLRRPRLAINVASELGIETLLKGVATRSELDPGALVDQWKEQLQPTRVHISPVLPYLREAAVLPESAYYRVPGLPSEPCPGSVVCIESNGKAFACCSPASPTAFLELGTLADDGLPTLHRRWQRQSKHRLLRAHGPAHFTDAIVAAGLGSRLRSHYAGPCDLCLHIANDPELSRIADDVCTRSDLALIESAFTRSDPPENDDARETSTVAEPPRQGRHGQEAAGRAAGESQGSGEGRERHAG